MCCSYLLLNFRSEERRRQKGDVNEKDMQLQPLNEKGGVSYVQPSSQKGAIQPSLLKALSRTFGATFVLGALFKLLHDILIFVSPQLLK